MAMPVPRPEAITSTTSDPVRFGPKERDYVFSVAMKYVKDEEEAADVTQDALLLAYRHRASFRGASRYTTWLYRIAATTSLMHLRKRRRTPQVLALPIGDAGNDQPRGLEPAATGPSPEDDMGGAEAARLAHRHLEDMGEKYGRIFMMRFFEGYTETEIARALGLNVSTVKTRAYRARTYLKHQLAAAI
jgi:RNA polymerase sigma-70 factor, ECF subfamily